MSSEHGTVKSIYVATDKGEPMQAYRHARALTGKGIAGLDKDYELVHDRYALDLGSFSRSPRQVVRHVSLIASEAIEQANNWLTYTDLDSEFTEQETRRNIVTSGVDLNRLVKEVFFIGEAALLGVELCDPCKRPEKLAGKPGFNDAFQYAGGLRAKVIIGGDFSVNDEVDAVKNWPHQ